MKQEQIEKAIHALKKELIDRFGADVELRNLRRCCPGDYHEHSEVDLLVVLPVPVNNAVEEGVFDLA